MRLVLNVNHDRPGFEIMSCFLPVTVACGERSELDRRILVRRIWLMHLSIGVRTHVSS